MRLCLNAKIILVLCPQVNPERPPLSLAYLASFLRSRDIEVTCLDLNIALYNTSDREAQGLWDAQRGAEWSDERRYREAQFVDSASLSSWGEKIEREDPRVVGFSVVATNLFTALRLAGEVRKRLPRTIIVFGGPEVFRRFGCNELHVFQEADALVIGEGEGPLAVLMRNVQLGQSLGAAPGLLVKRNGIFVGEARPQLIPELDTIPFPAYDVFALEAYRKKTELPLLFSRGCVNRCSFCFESRYWGIYRCRGVENVLAEIRDLRRRYSPRHFFLNDSLINGSMEFLAAFCNHAVRESLGITWVGMARVHPGMREPFLRTMEQAGCRFLTYGIESGSQAVLDRAHKNYSVSLIDEVLRDTFNAGIQLGVNLIVGLPGEGESEFQETCLFLRRNAPYIYSVNVSLLGVEPCTPLFEETGRLRVPREDGIDERVLVRRFNQLSELAREQVRLVSSFQD